MLVAIATMIPSLQNRIAKYKYKITKYNLEQTSDRFYKYLFNITLTRQRKMVRGRKLFEGLNIYDTRYPVEKYTKIYTSNHTIGIYEHFDTDPNPCCSDMYSILQKELCDWWADVAYIIDSQHQSTILADKIRQELYTRVRQSQ